MSEQPKPWWKPAWPRPQKLEPQLFWFYLPLCWLVAGTFFWLYYRRGDALSLALAVLMTILGLQAARVALRRRRERQQK